MTNNVEDLTQYLPRGGWITTSVPMTFNLNDVARFEKKHFIFNDGEELAYMIHVVLKHGDAIDLTYIEEANRDEDYEMLVRELRRSKLKVLNGKPGPKTNRQS
ncbi:MAG: hypothetical protein IKY94_06445 [Lachnospiraceae bacterium]|nr:hypothetical protein [Clostridia bacterium]MBR4982179.1 hypothetical protein [Lachnospiraceae bacterium]